MIRGIGPVYAKKLLRAFGDKVFGVIGRNLPPRRKPPTDLLVYCADYKCSHGLRMSADRWVDNIRLSDLEPLFVCQACSRRGADIRPDWDWDNIRESVTGVHFPKT